MSHMYGEEPPHTCSITVSTRLHRKLASYATRHGVTMRYAAEQIIGAILDADNLSEPTPVQPTHTDHADPGLL